MVDVEETQLAGVGVCHEFQTREGARIGVITHKSGRRDIVAYSTEDPDEAQEVAMLEEDESHILAELLGGTRVTKNLAETFQHSLAGLVIEWIHVSASWAAAGRTIGSLAVRTRTGVSVVAIVRGDQTIPSPGPSQLLEADDTVVAVGTAEGLQQTLRLLEGEPTS